MGNYSDKKYLEELIITSAPKPHWLVRVLFGYSNSIYDRLLLTMNILNVLDNEVLQRSSIIEGILLPSNLRRENVFCFLATERPVGDLSVIKQKWTEYEIYIFKSAIIIISKDKSNFNILEYFKILKEIPYAEATVIGSMEGEKNFKGIFSNLPRGKLYNQSILEEFTSFCYTQDNGYTLFGRDKALGPWTPEIEALIERDQSKLI